MDQPYKLKENFLTTKRFSYSGVIVFSIIGLCLFASRYYWNFSGPDYRPLAANFDLAVSSGQYWRLITTLFVHGDLSHLMSNSFLFAVIGFFVHRHYGLFIFPFLTLILGGVVNYIVLSLMLPNVYLVGISGVLYLLWGYWLILYLLIQRHLSLNRRLMKVIALSLMILVPTSYDPQVSYLAHGVGLAVGLVFGLCYYIVRRRFIHSFEVFEYVPFYDDPGDFEIDDLEEYLDESDSRKDYFH